MQQSLEEVLPKGGGQRTHGCENWLSHVPGHPGKEDSFKQGRKFFYSSLDLDIFLIATIELLENMRR